jgi:small subunit ribosomal protein S21|tara:strand:+ start:152 stop:436 length:285 start_codon:yes stop_codon:yes gene_type:complete
LNYNKQNNNYKKPSRKKFTREERPKQGLKVEVRGDDIAKALRILKKRMQTEGIFNEMRERTSFQTRSEKKRLKRAAGRRRWLKDREKQIETRGF